MTDPAIPIGTITPYSGDCGNAGVNATLGRLGWMPCDGSSLLIDDYPELYNVIRLNFGGEYNNGVPVRYNLPDLSSQFVRGVNLAAVDQATGEPVDPDAATRLASGPSGSTGNQVGSLQLPATGAPATPFTTEVRGSHQHEARHLTDVSHNALGGGSFDQAQSTGATATITADGEHAHRVDQGGDAETCPVSLSLFFIIKVF
jgi:microcystin-dependent protein